MHVAHSIFSQKLLQVHVLKLEEPPICRQGAIPQERPQELVETSSSISTTTTTTSAATATSSSTAITAIIVAYSTAIPDGAPSHGVLLKVLPLSLFVCRRQKSKMMISTELVPIMKSFQHT